MQKTPIFTADGHLQTNQTILYAEPEAYAAFLARLEMPPAPNARLRKTLQTQPPWERALDAPV